MCAKFQGDRNMRLCFIAILQCVRKDEESKLWQLVSRKWQERFPSNLDMGSPSWWATLQQIWFQSDKGSPRYKGVKMTFSFFLSIYPRCASFLGRTTHYRMS